MVLLSECITIGLQLKKHATRCSQVVVWLVWMGLMRAFQTRCEILEKTNTFLILLAFLLGLMSAVLCKIRVFHGWIWQFSGPR